jgi:hypothetical protein
VALVCVPSTDLPVLLDIEDAAVVCERLGFVLLQPRREDP